MVKAQYGSNIYSLNIFYITIQWNIFENLITLCVHLFPEDMEVDIEKKINISYMVLKYIYFFSTLKLLLDMLIYIDHEYLSSKFYSVSHIDSMMGRLKIFNIFISYICPSHLKIEYSYLVQLIPCHVSFILFSFFRFLSTWIVARWAQGNENTLHYYFHR